MRAKIGRACVIKQLSLPSGALGLHPGGALDTHIQMLAAVSHDPVP